MLTKKHLVGIGVSMALFGLLGIMVGGISAGIAGLALQDPIDLVATGPTARPLSGLTTPFGVTPAALGLAPDAMVVLPGIPISVNLFGIVLSLSGLTVAQVSSGGGMVFGFFVGSYYAVDIARKQRTET